MAQGLRLAEMRRAFTAWAQRHPERGHQPRRFGLADAPRQAWPCPRC
ncbi:MAG: Rap1a/Tai family immunity protein [Alphaproteobacteria bacterium]